MKDLKNTVTTICGIILVICGALKGCIEAGVILPAWVNTFTIVGGAISGAIVAYFTGRNSDGSKKSDAQLTTKIVA